MPTGSRGSSLPAPPRAVRRRALSPAVMTVFSLVGAALVVASNSAVTPLYRLYQQSMHLTPLMITLVFALTALMMVLLFVMPETVSRKAGAFASLRPRVSVPRQSRAALLRVTPASIAAWAFGGFYLSLMPTVVATTLGVRAPWVGGIVVAAPWLSAALTVGALRQLAARRLLVLGTGALSLGVVASLLGIWQHSVAAL